MISLEVNGKHHKVNVSPDVPLLWVIREYLKLTGTKYGCGIGMCGSCTVHIDGQARRSCQVPLGDARGKRITTIEGLPEDHPVKKGWIEEQVPQCGYCQPGQIMQAAALLSEESNPSEERIIKGMDGVLCRCGTYPRIKRAMRGVIKESKKGISKSPLGAVDWGLTVGKASPSGDGFSPSPWLLITPDNIVTVIVGKSEMGQGVSTSLPMIVADEIEADWEQVRVKMAPAGEEYKDPVWGMQTTGGSTSIRHMFGPLRKASAAAREMLVSAAAQTWTVPVLECEAYRGRVRHTESGRSLSYGQLCQKAAKIPIPPNPPLKKKSQFGLIGTSMPRLDVPDKVNGSAIFGMDVFIPDMLYAAVVRPPAYGTKAISSHRKAAEKVPGVRKVVDLNRRIAVCADTLDAAWKGRDALQVTWDKGAHPHLNNDTLEEIFVRHLDKRGKSARNHGNVNRAMNRAVQKIEATYILPYLSHATMEPMNCTAHVREDTCEVWAPTQDQSGVLQTVKEVTGLKPEQIHVYTTYLGGGFGRRLESDFVEEALHVSKATGKPIKLIWTREEDMQNDFYRPATCSKIQGGIDGKGRLIAWAHKLVAPSIFSRVYPQMVTDGIDPAAVEGAVGMKYEIPNIHVEYVRIDVPVPVGFWRSVGHSHNAFSVESFVDELAHAARKDPLEFRLDLLKNHPRPRRVLEVAAEKALWGKSLPKGHGRGIAQHFSFGSYVAQVAEVSVNEKDGKVRVYRIVCVVDCGPAINPDTITALMEGGIIFGLSAALKERVHFARGGVASANFHNYEILPMSQAPEIEVHIVKSDAKLGGVGEPGVPPTAPSVANAVFAAAGARVRRLPMKPETVMGIIKEE
ncbi:MAG: molybdopterin-dependent oxidoreductase [Proteobacteria bacterium]|nr:molybdopterin-dependent oxidoreductase [Pseudomonadota bacterium]